MPEPNTATSNRPSDPEDPRRPEICPRILRDRSSNFASVGRGVDPRPTPAGGGQAQRLMPRYAAAIQLTVIAARTRRIYCGSRQVQADDTGGEER